MLLFCRILLAGVFSVAGIAKLLDPVGSRQAILAFGIPAIYAAPLVIILPLVELAVAVALVPVSTAWWGGIMAFMLLLLFVVLIGVNLAQGRKPECHCFGQIHAVPVGWSVVIRNVVLAAMAGFVVWQGWDDAGASVVSWPGFLTVTEMVISVTGLAMFAFLVVEGWLSFHLLRQNGRLLLRIEALEAKLTSGGTALAAALAQPAAGLAIGTSAPDFRLSGLYGKTITLAALRAFGKPVLLIFSDSGCGPCNALLPAVGRWQRDYANLLTVALISRGTAEAMLVKSAQHGLTHVLLQDDHQIAQAYKVRGTPSAVIVRADNTIGSPLSPGAEDIEALVTRSLVTLRSGEPAAKAVGSNAVQPVRAALTTTPARRIGEQAPALKLPDLTGQIIELADFRASRTLVLFWNPQCGFCSRMLNELKAWERNPPKDAPKLLVVSAGTTEENKAMGLRSPVVLDQGFDIGRAFGAGGTPSAVLIDGAGNIASPAAGGAPAVLALAWAGGETAVNDGAR